MVVHSSASSTLPSPSRSLQVPSGPGMQTSAMHASPTVHGLPSLHGLPSRSVFVQAVTLQTSSVHGSASAQSSSLSHTRQGMRVGSSVKEGLGANDAPLVSGGLACVL